MPQIDLSSVLTSPYLVDFFDVIRRQETIGSTGKSSLISATFTGVFGVVTPGGRNRMNRSEDSTTQEKSILISTRFMLRGASKDNTSGYQPDLVKWGGDFFLVVDCRDNSKYGSGFTKALCEVTNFVPQPPVPSAGVLVVDIGGRLQLFVPTITSPTSAVIPFVVQPQNMIVLRNGLPIFSSGDFTVSSDISLNTIITLVVPLNLSGPSPDTLAIYV